MVIFNRWGAYSAGEGMDARAQPSFTTSRKDLASETIGRWSRFVPSITAERLVFTAWAGKHLSGSIDRQEILNGAFSLGCFTTWPFLNDIGDLRSYSPTIRPMVCGPVDSDFYEMEIASPVG